MGFIGAIGDILAQDFDQLVITGQNIVRIDTLRHDLSIE
jgi:hypothetical protein